MKIIKTKEVVTEEIEINPGTYYFEDEDITYHKFVLEKEDDAYSEYVLQTLINFSNRKGIIIKDDGAWESDDLPYVFRQFILGISGKKIEKEDFEKEKQEILDSLCNKY